MSLSVYEDSTVWKEVQEIIKKSKGGSLFHFRGILHTEKEDIELLDLNHIETVRNYLDNCGEVKNVTFKLATGDYVNRLYPYRDNLEFTLTRVPQEKMGFKKDQDKRSVTNRYKAYFNPAHNPPVAASDLQQESIHDLNTSSLCEIRLELMDRWFEQVRMKTVSGVFQDTNILTYMHAAIGSELGTINVDGKPVIEVLEIYPPLNKSKIPHLLIPAKMRIVSLPTFLQDEVGIYNRGIGTYWQRYHLTDNKLKTFFVYPTFDVERYEKMKIKMNFYAVPQNKMASIEESYYVDNQTVKVAVTAQRLYNDDAMLSAANGDLSVCMPSANSYMRKPIQPTIEGPVGIPKKLTNSYVITQDGEQVKDKTPYIKMTRDGPSSNNYVQQSRVMSRLMAQMDLVWENGDDELIYPGMPCKYVYLSQGKPKEVKGVILFVHSFCARQEKQTMQAFKNTVRVSIACERQDEKPSVPYMKYPTDHNK